MFFKKRLYLKPDELIEPHIQDRLSLPVRKPQHRSHLL